MRMIYLLLLLGGVLFYVAYLNISTIMEGKKLQTKEK